MNVVPLTPTESDIDPWDAFWMLQVKRVGKHETKLQWLKLTVAEQMEAIEAALKWRSIWLQTDPAYLLHPVRWLKYRRFEDELPTTVVSTQQLSHIPFEPTQPVERGVMPDKVRAELERIKQGMRR